MTRKDSLDQRDERNELNAKEGGTFALLHCCVPIAIVILKLLKYSATIAVIAMGVVEL